MRTRPADLVPEAAQARPAAPPPKPAANKKKPGEVQPLRFYQVIDGPRKAGDPNKIGPFRRNQGDYFLSQGSEISSHEFDIKDLRNHGAKLEEIETPGWFIEQQDASRAKAEELRAAGVHVPEVPEFHPTPVEKKAPARGADAS